MSTSGHEFSVEAAGTGGLIVVAVAGEADLFTAPQVKEALLTAIDDGATRLIIDFSRTTFIDSTVLGILISARRRLAEAGGQEIALVVTDRNVIKVLEITHLDRIFEIFPDLESASAAGGPQA